MMRLTNLQKNASSFRQQVHFWFAQQLNDQKSQGTIAALDGVRALAFLLVFYLHINHTGVWGDGGNQLIAAIFAAGRTGVTLFFVLSGFLLFLPYTQALLFEKNWPQSKIYYIRRVLRIFPGYFFSLFILVIFAEPYFIQPHNWIQLLPFLTFTMGYNNAGAINGPYWTLAVEFQYYLILPLIALVILRLTRLVRPERRLWVVVGSLLAMIVWGLLMENYGGYFFNHPDQTFLVPRPVLNVVLFFVYGDHGKFLEDFAIGMLIAVGYLCIMNSPRKEFYLQRVRPFLPWLLIVCMAIFVYAILPAYPLPVIHSALQFLTIPWMNEFTFALCYGGLVTAVLFDHPEGWLVHLFSWTQLRWLGLISYSMYIWHRPLLQILAANLGTSLRRLEPVLRVGLFWLIGLTVTITFCFVIFVLIEKPGMRLSERLRQQILSQDAKRRAMLEGESVKEQEMEKTPVFFNLKDKNSMLS
jgi:peptidoglycan/LPS O-acetylase OafA/YrhL